MEKALNWDIIIIGAGVVGAAIGHGIAKRGKRVLLLDGGDRDFRAARANFGLVWVQGKGANVPDYNIFTRRSSVLWPDFLLNLNESAKTKVDYSQPGGLNFCLSETDFTNRRALIERTHNQNAAQDAWMVERAELERMLPAIRLGPDVVGASYCDLDGHVNPLQLLVALHKSIISLGGEIIFRNPVSEVTPIAGGFSVNGPQCFEAERVVVAAGLDTPRLTAPLGLEMPLRSERGQILVMERMEQMLPYPASGLRQTAEGTIMIGATNEDSSDAGVTVSSAVKLARKATRIVPALGAARLIRQWSGMRILSPDKAPIYAQSPHYPGLFAASCHSGVTLAAAHSEILAPAIINGALKEELAAFSNGRFNVQKCA